MFSKIRSALSGLLELPKRVATVESLLVEQVYQQRLAGCLNPFARNHARKFFSQSDEDGLTLEILRRLQAAGHAPVPRFVEFGVGDGLENNSLVLLATGWCGSWFSGEALAFETAGLERLRFQKTWITLENVLTLYRKALADWGVEAFGVISLDLDGNDYHLLERLLGEQARPTLFICEYNAQLPPGCDWRMPYDSRHVWNLDARYGASLDALVTLFERHGYFLVACNPQTGANAFFIRQEFRSLFPEVPEEIEAVRVPAFYRIQNRFTHPVSPRFIQDVIR